jgi:hypothetical protein
MKASDNPRDIERYDTLCDVNMSCMAAVDILNDLLCYEKLESGILELHKENILASSFLTDCVAMFSAQARECGVTISTVTDVDEVTAALSSAGKVSHSLLSADVIFADRFKMNQVIRNLVSNALKFTPRGGSVTINASFVLDSIEDLLKTSAAVMPAPATAFASAFASASGIRYTTTNIITTFSHLLFMLSSPFIHVFFTFYSCFLHLLFMLSSPFIHVFFTFYSCFLHLLFRLSSPFIHAFFTFYSCFLHLLFAFRLIFCDGFLSFYYFVLISRSCCIY